MRGFDEVSRNIFSQRWLLYQTLRVAIIPSVVQGYGGLRRSQGRTELR
ncbi:hypothetical protein [Nostoc sp. JL33]|nr:hypothetical protein [Nostoc sp. JL33]MBN3869293.1 hypothetical protein [Nostoc sp. JL33]